MAYTPVPSGSPDFGASARDFVSWWTAALARPYPIIPGVAPLAGSAPGSTRSPPEVFKWRLASRAAMVEVQTLCNLY